MATASDLRVAAERFDEGRLAFKAGSYAEAAEHFEAADARAPSASALGLAMRSRAEAGQLQRAATLAELVLRRHAEDAELVEKAKNVIAAAKDASGSLRITCDPECDLVADEKLVHGRSATAWTLYLEPGEHTIAAYWPGDKAATERVSLAVGQVRDLQFKPVTDPPQPKPVSVAPVPEPNPNARPSNRDSLNTNGRKLPPLVFWIGVGATAVSGGVAVWSGIDTLNSPGKDAVRSGCVGLGEDCELYRQGQRNELRTNVLIGTTLVLAAGTALTGLFFTDFSPKEAHVARLRPWFVAHPTRSADNERRGVVTVLGAEGRF